MTHFIIVSSSVVILHFNFFPINGDFQIYPLVDTVCMSYSGKELLCRTLCRLCCGVLYSPPLSFVFSINHKTFQFRGIYMYCVNLPVIIGLPLLSVCRRKYIAFKWVKASYPGINHFIFDMVVQNKKSGILSLYLA